MGNHEDLTKSVAIQETDNKTLPHKTVFKLDPSQQEDRKVEEGNDGYDVTVIQRAVFQDGRTYHDSFRSVYDAVDTVVTFKKQADLDAEKAKMDSAAAGGVNPA